MHPSRLFGFLVAFALITSSVSVENISLFAPHAEAKNTVAKKKVAKVSCVIKGNISAKGEKIYHEPGCLSYKKTVIDPSAGEQWFCTAADAEAAGWRRALNCY